MPLHLVKLFVGAATIAELEHHIDERLAGCRMAEEPLEVVHTTRMMPTRSVELLDGGSLYWVIRGQISARQRLRDIQPFTDDDGIGRCRLKLDPAVVPVVSRPHRPFQGWRYLLDAERPADLSTHDGAREMPERLRHDLRELCLL